MQQIGEVIKVFKLKYSTQAIRNRRIIEVQCNVQQIGEVIKLIIKLSPPQWLGIDVMNPNIEEDHQGAMKYAANRWSYKIDY